MDNLQQKKLIPLTVLIIIIAVASAVFVFFQRGDTRVALRAESGGQATLSLFPEHSSYQINDDFDLDILIDTDGQGVVVAFAEIYYEPSYFKAVSIDVSQSVFSLEAENIIDSQNGKVKICRGSPTPGINISNGKLATIRFKALAETSPASDNITFRFDGIGAIGDSEVILDDSNGTDILSVVNNGKYAIAIVDTILPDISNIEVSITENSAVVNWFTNELSNSRVQYGLTEKYGTVTSIEPALIANHQMLIEGLTPSTKYHFQVSSRDRAGNIGYSKDQTFTTKSFSGYPEGSLLRAQDGFRVYIINSFGYKRHIFNPVIFEMYGHMKWEDIQDIFLSNLDFYQTSDIYQAEGDHKIYSLEEVSEVQGIAIKHHVNMTPAQFEAKGYNWNQIFIVNSSERDYYQTGTDLVY